MSAGAPNTSELQSQSACYTPAARGPGQPRYDRRMAQWLVKEEPEHYGYDKLEKDGKTVWAGVRNPLAQKHLREIRRGDRIFYYHTGKEKAVVAIAKAASHAYADPPTHRESCQSSTSCRRNG